MTFIPQSVMQRKLLLLYIAKSFEFPLTEEQFAKIIADNQWMAFFDYKDNLSELIANGQLALSPLDGLPVYRLTPEGETALVHFEKDIVPSMKQAVHQYIERNRELIKTQTLLESSYRYMLDDRLEVTLQIREKSGLLMCVTLYVEDEQEAARICQNWQDTSPDFYRDLMRKITQKPE